MLIPHFHFAGDCKEAIALYEKAFCSQVEAVITSREYGSEEPGSENRIAHAVMCIHGQKVFLNDRFGKKDTKTDIALHMIVTFFSTDELLSAYEILKEGCTIIDPLEKLPYSALAVQFIDRHGVQWGFMVDESTKD
jgi:PhnB protein